MAIKDFMCPLKDRDILPMVEFIEKDDEQNCGPCTIPPLSSYYLAALEDAGEKELAHELKEVYKTGDILTIAKKLDTIKDDVGEALRAELKELDCFAQVFKDES